MVGAGRSVQGDRPAGVSVVIPTLGQTFLAQCLEALAGQQCHAYEVIVVENGERQPDTARLVAHHDGAMDIHYRYLEQPGSNRARNAGAELAKYNILAFTDDDCLPDPGWTRALLDNARLALGEAVIGGRVDLLFPDGEPGWFKGTLRHTVSELDWGDAERKLEGRQYLVSANMALATRLFRDCGGFEPGVGFRGRKPVQLFNDEIELLRRLQRQGVDCWFDPRVVVRHIVPAERTTIAYHARRRYCQALSDVHLATRQESTLDLPALVARYQREKSSDAWINAQLARIVDVPVPYRAHYRRIIGVLRRASLVGMAEAITVLMERGDLGVVRGDRFVSSIDRIGSADDENEWRQIQRRLEARIGLRQATDEHSDVNSIQTPRVSAT